MKNINFKIEELSNWLKEKVEAANAKGVVFGLSGGIDSAVIAGLGKIAFPNTSLGIIMPINSNIVDEKHALLVADSLNLQTEKVDLSNIYDMYINQIGILNNNKLAQANLKPRLRMMTLYYYAQNYNYLVVGSSNKSEFVVGYFTKHGDSGVDLLPLADFVKADVRELAKALDVPEIIITKPPTAGLWENQTDEDEMGFSYDILDEYIHTNKGPKEIIEKIERMHKISKHKREFPPIFLNNK